VPACDGSYLDTDGRQVKAFQASDILVRRGAQTVRANQADLDRLLARARPEPEPSEVDQRELLENLPPREQVAVDFVGRSEELLLLWDWFSEPLRPRWLLAGDGGKGKTAIAYEFATQVRAAEPRSIEGILWLSAKRRRFQQGETLPVTSGPDFYDLSSLLDAIASFYGFSDLPELPTGERRTRVAELLKELPILMVADDIDSLDEDSEDALEFLTLDLARTPSKVLLTSRRVPFGLNASATQVWGLTRHDGAGFIRSRLRLLGLDPSMFTDRVTHTILEVTDGSPLYIEDLVRLCSVIPVEQAIERWREHGGDEARKYALRAEFDRLSEKAREIVLACCLTDQPVSLAEIQAITNLSEDQLLEEIAHIQDLFLLSQPRLIEGVPRFDVNLNTKLLVRRVYEGTHLIERLNRAYEAMSGRLETSQRQRSDIAAFINQAISFDRLGRTDEAERTLKIALTAHPEHPDLLGQLAVIYALATPARMADAEDLFKRSAQLKCKREIIYRTWAQMELNRNEFSAAMRAAEAGLGNAGRTAELLFLAGIAHSRIGQELRRQLNERADEELGLAYRLLHEALRRPEALRNWEERLLNSKVFRALAINSEALGQFELSRFLPGGMGCPVSW